MFSLVLYLDYVIVFFFYKFQVQITKRNVFNGYSDISNLKINSDKSIVYYVLYNLEGTMYYCEYYLFFSCILQFTYFGFPNFKGKTRRHHLISIVGNIKCKLLRVSENSRNPKCIYDLTKFWKTWILKVK
jgi:hypothetical protein